MSDLTPNQQLIPHTPKIPGAAYVPGMPDRQIASLRDFLWILFRHKALVIAIFLSTVLGTCLWLWLGYESYEASAKVLIKFARDAADPRTSLSPTTTRVLPETKPDINTEAELIKSYALVSEVVTTLHLDEPQPQIPPPGLLPTVKFELRRTYHWLRDLVDDVEIMLAFKDRLSSKEKAIVELIQGLKVETVKDSSIVNVKLSVPGRNGAGTIVNTLLKLYREHRLAVEKDTGETDFFESQADEYNRKLHEEEQDLETLKQKYDIASLPDQITLELKNVTEVERAARESAATLAANEAKVALLKQQLQEQAPTRVTSQVQSRNSELDFLNEKKAALELEREKLAAKYGDDTLEVRDVDEQINEAKRLIANADSQVKQSETTSPNSTFEDLQRELLSATQLLESTRARYQSQMEGLAKYKADLRSLLRAEIAYNQATREIQVNEETYRLDERNAIEAKAAEALRAGWITSIEVVDPAVDPILPSGIRATYLAGGSVLVGLVLAIAFALISETLDHAVNRPEEVEVHLGCSVWSSVGLYRAGQIAAPPIDELKQQLLATASKLEADRRNERIVLFRAAGPQSGATTVAGGVAYVLSSQLGKKILLVEITSGSPELADIMRLDSVARPSADIARNGWRDSCVRLNANLNLLSFKLASPELTEKQIAERIRLLPRTFPECDYILIDLGSSVPAHECMGVAQACSGVVLIVEAERTRYEVLERLRQEYEREHVLILGAVLNRRRFVIPQRLYNSI